MIKAGIVPRRPKPLNVPQWAFSSDTRKVEIATGTVLETLLEVRMRGIRNSFQYNTKMRTPLATRPGMDRGNAIRKNAVHNDPPSTITDSIISFGIVAKKDLMTQITRDVCKPTNAMIRPIFVSINPKY
jgi:hypothetical protein